MTTPAWATGNGFVTTDTVSPLRRAFLCEEPMKTKRFFNGMTDRYSFDGGLCSARNGFAQVDTKQDASYYGNWANPFTRTTVSYAEGDITIIECDDDAEFVQKVRNDAAWHDQAGYGPMRIDPMGNESIREHFVSLGLEDLLH